MGGWVGGWVDVGEKVDLIESLLLFVNAYLIVFKM